MKKLVLTSITNNKGYISHKSNCTKNNLNAKIPSLIVIKNKKSEIRHILAEFQTSFAYLNVVWNGVSYNFFEILFNVKG